MAELFLNPESAKAKLLVRYQRRAASWLESGETWDGEVRLGPPTSRQVDEDRATARRWISSWRTFDHPEWVRWESRRWSSGTQEVPVVLQVPTIEALALFLGLQAEWGRAVARASLLSSLWPSSRGQWGKVFQDLSNLTDTDFTILVNLTSWLVTHPSPGCRLREIPVAGLDTKWVETRRRLVTSVLMVADPRPQRFGSDFYSVTGLTTEEPKVQVRFLCPELRQRSLGLDNVISPLSEIAALDIHPVNTLILENKTSGVALPDLPDTVAIMGLGRASGLLAQIPWLASSHVFYWGDIDTWGLVILDQALRAVPHLEPLLMDRNTLERFQKFAVFETIQERRTESVALPFEQKKLLEDLRNNTWGVNVRVEQEKLPWDYVMTAVNAALFGKI